MRERVAREDITTDARTIRNEIHLGDLETSFVNMRPGVGEVGEVIVAVTVIPRLNIIFKRSPGVVSE